MAYTTLRMSEAGVVLLSAHRKRLGTPWAMPFDDFAKRAKPGIYSVLARDERFSVKRLESSRLWDGIATRYLVSPIANAVGPQTKMPPPSPWDAVRQPGVATLLTNADGTEIYESCAAAVIAWDGQTLVGTPEYAPRVASITESYLFQHHPYRRAPIRRDSGWPLVLVNAVAGVCTCETAAFPREILTALRTSLSLSAKRP